MEIPDHQQFAISSERQGEPLSFAATVTFCTGSRRAAVRVREISTLGARISGVYLARVDDRVFLTLPGLEGIEARVAWVGNFEFGCEFSGPLDPLALESLVQGSH